MLGTSVLLCKTFSSAEGMRDNTEKRKGVDGGVNDGDGGEDDEAADNGGEDNDGANDKIAEVESSYNNEAKVHNMCNFEQSSLPRANFLANHAALLSADADASMRLTW